MLPRVCGALVIACALTAFAGCGVGNEGLGEAQEDGGPPGHLTTPDAATATGTPPGDAGLVDVSAGNDDALDEDAFDASSDLDSPAESDSALGAQDDSGPCANAAAPCVVVPNGWSLVAFASTRSSTCPAGFDTAPSDDVIEGPNASTACSCGGCSVKSSPSCAAGPIAVSYDEKGTFGQGLCGLTADPSPLANSPPGACGTDLYSGDYAVYDVDYAAPPATGGTCRTPGVASAAAVTYASQDRACTPNSMQAANCAGNVCAPTLTGSYAACITTPGAVACPPGPLGVQHVVGASASVSCGDCACTVTGTCSGTLTLFTDTACTKGANPVATGSCKPITTVATYRAYEYQGGTAADVACAATSTATSAPDVTLMSDATICCAQ